MKSILKNIIVCTFLVSYSILIFSPPTVSNEYNGESQKGTVSITELTKLLFPQHINPDGFNLNSVNIYQEGPELVKNPYLISKCLSLHFTQKTAEFIKYTATVKLNLPSFDIVYPFYDFW